MLCLSCQLQHLYLVLGLFDNRDLKVEFICAFRSSYDFQFLRVHRLIAGFHKNKIHYHFYRLTGNKDNLLFVKDVPSKS